MKALNTMSLAGFFALGLAKGIFAQICATNVLETWKAGAIPQVSYHFESTVDRWDMAARDDATREEIFSFALSDGPPVVTTTEGFVFWISGVGMRAKFDHVSEFNFLLNGVATSVSQDDNPSRTKTVFNAANMQQLMDSEEGDLLPSRNSPEPLATLTSEQAKFLKSLEGQWIRNKVPVDRKGVNEKVSLKAVIIKKSTFEFVGLNDLKRQFKCTRISVKDQEVDLATFDAEQPLRYLMKLDGQTMWLVAKANDKYEAPWATEPINYDLFC